MSRLIVILALSLVCWSAPAQKLTKEEKKAQRIERRAEREREQHIKDSIYWAKIFAKQDASIEARKNEGATAIVATTSIPAADALNTIARSLISSGYVIRVDKEYGTINTEPIWGNGASYSLHYVVEEKPEGSQVKGFAYAHGQVSAFSLGLGIGTSKLIDVRIEYGGVENSTSMIAFRALHKNASSLPDVSIKYVHE